MKNKHLTLWVLSSIAPLAFATTQHTGYFIDAPVTGLYYETDSNIKGITQKGAFQYNTGDVVSFYLGVDNNAYLLTKLSGQTVVTPTLSTTTPSRSINMTRLLLSLDNTPEDQAEIELLGDMLADPAFQKQLRMLDLNLLDDMKDKLNFDIVPVKAAVEHLNQSQQYIERHFTSDDVIYSPLNQRLTTIIIRKKDYTGRHCVLDLRYIKRPRHNSPIGEMHYMITPSHIIQYPGMGDLFNACYRNPAGALESTIEEPMSNFSNMQGLVGCSQKGCTRSDLNGFLVDDYDDEGDWKYRTMAINFDPTTQLFMEKVQGLGPNGKVLHSNQGEMMWFTYPEAKGHKIDYEGVWKETTYQETDMQETCLLFEGNTVLQGQKNTDTCPTKRTAYRQDVTADYGDMWWLNAEDTPAQLAQMNVTVRWYPKGKPPLHTTWEYLPAGATWDQGMLYRYQQIRTQHSDGSDTLQTFAISEFTKQF
ncbi:chromosome partitioning protein ParA [Photobacterium japonica]|uniref:chromosome partitioning protein ParA n=1 Tax=Photobacterium japonica TaxID=2910235 RepID=UPI003D11D1CA